MPGLRLAVGSCIVLALALPESAGAQVALTAQDREVRASSSSFGNLWDIDSSPFFPSFDPPTLSLSDLAEDSVAAPDLVPFSDTASTIDPPLIAVAPQGSASASQTSSLSEALVSASGSFSNGSHSRLLTAQEIALANAFLSPPVPFGSGLLGDLENGDSDFSVSFDVTVATPYTLTGTLALTSPYLADGFFPLTAGEASIVLSGGPLGLVEYASIAQDALACDPAPCGGDTIDVQGVLAPGSYTLTARVGGAAEGICVEFAVFSCHTPSSSGSFDLTLTLEPLPVPALPPVGLSVGAALLAWLGVASLRRTRKR